MGRYFQATQGNYISDAMMDLPVDLMAKVITDADKNVDDTISSTVGLYDKLDASGLVQDTPRLQEIMKGYEGSIDGIVEQIKKDPLQYNRKLGDIRKLGRDIKNDFSTGEVGAIQARKEADDNWWKEAKELQKKNPELYDDNYLRTLRQRNLSESGNVNYKGPSDYTQYSANSAIGLGNMNEWVDARLKDALPDGSTVTQDKKTGGWIVTTEEGSIEMSPKKLNDILQSSLAADGSMQAAIQQRSQLGIDGFAGMVGEDGLNPASQVEDREYTDEKGEKQTVPVLQFANNMLGHAFRAGVEKYGFEKATFKSSMKADPFSLKAQDLKDKQAMKEWDEKRNTDSLQYSTSNTINSVGGTTVQNFVEDVTTTKQKIQDLKTQASEVVSLELGDIEMPEAAQTLIDKGNFTALGNLKDAEGQPLIKSTTINTLQREYNDTRLREAMLAGVEQDFNITHPNGDEAAFNTYLKARDGIAQVQHFTWEGTGVTEPERKRMTNDIITSGKHLLYPLEVPEGTTVKDKNGNSREINGMSITQMIQQGFVEKEQVKVPFEQKIDGYTTPEGEQISQDTYETRYRMVDGSGYIDFNVDANSIAPTTSYDDDMKLELGMIMDFRGEKVLAKIDEITTSKLKGYEKANSGMLRTNYFLSQMSNIGETVLPDSNGVKITNGKDGQILRIPDGNGGYISHPIGGDKFDAKGFISKIINR